MSVRDTVIHAKAGVNSGRVTSEEADEMIQRSIAGDISVMLKVTKAEDIGSVFAYIKNELSGFYEMSDTTLRRLIANESAKIQSEFYAMTPQGSPLRLDQPVSISDMLATFEEQIRLLGCDNAVRFGVYELDEACGGGFYPGELCVLVGGTGSMKTSLALSMVEEFVLEGLGRALYVTVDMTPEEIYLRLILREAFDSYGEKQMRSMAAQGHPDYINSKQRMLEKYDGRLVVVGHEPQKRINLDRYRWHVGKEIPDLVIIDYLTALDHGWKSDLEFVSQAMPQIHGLAQELKIPVLILSQMSRSSKTNQNSGQIGCHARGGGIVEELSTIEVELRREEKDDGQKAQIFATVTKTRRGVAGQTFMLDYKGKSMRFTGVAERAERVIARKPVFKLRE